MNKHNIRLGITIAASLCFAVPAAMTGAGCSSTNNGGGTTTNSSSTSTGQGSNGGAGDSGATNSTPCPDQTMVIDDMTAMAGPTNTGGYWYTYSDRTCVAPQPPLITDAGGTLMPEEGQQYVATDDGTGPTVCGGMHFPYRDFSGGGETNWGAGMGFDFADTSNVNPYSQCTTPESCTGQEAPNAFTPMGDAGQTYKAAYDASKHKGISFWARTNNSSALKVDVHISDKTTTPGGADPSAGGCNLCLYGASTGANRCADDWIETETLTGTWTQYTVKFSDVGLKTAGWSATPTKSRPSSALDLTTLYFVHFQISTSNDGNPLKPFEFQVAYVTWVDD